MAGVIVGIKSKESHGEFSSVLGSSVVSVEKPGILTGSIFRDGFEGSS